ncbi:hypothetical protein H0H87_001794, partial [Tephrocybe sp. NHM501043]
MLSKLSGRKRCATRRISRLPCLCPPREEVVLALEWDDCPLKDLRHVPTRQCAICALKRFLYGHEQDNSERRMRNRRHWDRHHRHEDIDLGPLIGAASSRGSSYVVAVSWEGSLYGLRTTTRAEIVDEEETEDELELLSTRLTQTHAGLSCIHMRRGRPFDPALPPVDVRQASAAVPPKMRKEWMRKAVTRSRDVDMASPENQGEEKEKEKEWNGEEIADEMDFDLPEQDYEEEQADEPDSEDEEEEAHEISAETSPESPRPEREPSVVPMEEDGEEEQLAPVDEQPALP